MLNAYIQSPPNLLFDPPFWVEEDLSCKPAILELGSGTGIVAETLAERLHGCRATLVVTDLPEVCPLLTKNLHRHTSDKARPTAPTVLVRPLTWGSESEACEIAVELGRILSRTEAPTLPHITHVVCSDLVSTAT